MHFVAAAGMLCRHDGQSRIGAGSLSGPILCVAQGLGSLVRERGKSGSAESPDGTVASLSSRDSVPDKRTRAGRGNKVRRAIQVV